MPEVKKATDAQSKSEQAAAESAVDASEASKAEAAEAVDDVNAKAAAGDEDAQALVYAVGLNKPVDEKAKVPAGDKDADVRQARTEGTIPTGVSG
jgi:hypothetical protein